MALDDDGDESAASRWKIATRVCLARRWRPDQQEFQDAFTECLKTPLPGVEIAKILFASVTQAKFACDPLLAFYLGWLLAQERVNCSDVLEALFANSPYSTTTPADTSATDGDRNRLRLAQAIAMVVLSKTFAAMPTDGMSRHEAAATLRALMKWVKALNAHDALSHIDPTHISNPDSSFVLTCEEMGAFIVLLFGNIVVRQHLIHVIPKKVKPNMRAHLDSFAATLGQWSQSGTPQRLQLLTKLPPLFDRGHPDDPPLNLSASDIAAEVIDIPRSTTRVGVYIYLNAALSARPLIDDAHVLSFLQARYGGDHQTMIGDLVVGAFDDLANVLHRHESQHTILCHRSFITSKIPLLIAILSMNHIYQPGILEQWIQVAMARIETHPFPPISSDTTGLNDVLGETRRDFINVCHLHQLVTEGTAVAAIGQTPSAKSSGGRYDRQALYNQVVTNVQRAEELVNELDRMSGDAGAISNALVEALRFFTNTKETTSMKRLCTALCRKLPFVDIILQHNNLLDLIIPVCSFLNDWALDEDQGELQPAYDDFAPIMLFALAVIHRYDIDSSELDMFGRESFVQFLLTKLSECKSSKDITETDSQILSRWSKGLFAVDDKGESSGISDETMSGCSPQTFYKLVPTLFEQIMLACRSKSLLPNTLREGLEFLLEPFLLPSLIGGLLWLSKYTLTHLKDIEISLQIMHKLLKPASISGDSAAMHKTILAILYTKLRSCLQEIDKRAPNRKDTPQLIAILKPFADSGFTTGGSVAEIKEWTESSGTLKQAVAEFVSQLTTWSTQSDLIPVPPKYTHKTVTVAIQVCGAFQVLDVLVDEVTAQTSIGLGSSALEVATSLICVPPSQPVSISPSALGSKTSVGTAQLSLQRALKLRLGNQVYLMKTDHAKVESLIRLGRSVDLQSVAINMPLLSTMQMGLPNNDLMQDINTSVAVDVTAPQTALEPADQAALDAANADFAAAMDNSLDLTTAAGDLNMTDAGGLNLDLNTDLFGGDTDLTFDLGMDTSVPLDTSQQQSQSAQMPQQSNDDDIFAGIDLGMMDDDFTFD